MPNLIYRSSQLIGSGIIFLAFAATAYAQAGSALVAPPSGSINSNAPLEAAPQFVVNLLFSLATVLAVIYLMYGGIRWITSRGDRQAVDAAKKHITAAVIGLVVVVGAFFILNSVLGLLGVKDNPLKSGFKPFGT